MIGASYASLLGSALGNVSALTNAQLQQQQLQAQPGVHYPVQSGTAVTWSDNTSSQGWADNSTGWAQLIQDQLEECKEIRQERDKPKLTFIDELREEIDCWLEGALD